MERFWDLFGSSVIIQSIITLLLVATNCYLWLSKSEVPQDLANLTWAIIAFWMGSKVQHAAEKRAIRGLPSTEK